MAAFTDYKALDFSGVTKAIDKFQQRQTLSRLGEGLDGTPEGYAKAGQSLLALGDVQGAQNFFALGETARERSSTLENDNRIFQGLGLSGGGMGAPRAPVAPAVEGLSRTAAPVGAAPASPRGVAVAETPDAVARLEAASSGLTQLGNANEPRGLRNNNPGNIESGRFAATVQGFQGSDGRFAQYATPEQGIQAADKLLTSYAGRGLNTVAGIVNRWAPPTENNTGAYTAAVARELGVDPNQPLDMNNWETRQKLIAAKIRVENGKQPYSEDVFQRALNPNWGREVAAFEGGAQPNQTAPAGPQCALGSAPPPAGQFAEPPPAQVAQAAPPAVQRGAAPIPGDNPAQLRQEAQAYAQTNPEAARQMIARADAIEQASGVQTAQAGGDPRADQTPGTGAPAQGFIVPSTGEVVPVETIANNPRLRNLAAAIPFVRDPAKRAGLENMFKLELEATKERMGAEGRELDKQAKRQAIENAKTPEGVREFLYARENGLTKAKTPVEYAREKAGSDATPAIKEFEYARRNGFQGTILDYEREKAASKAKPGVTAADQKAIFSAEDQIPLFDNTIATLQRARDLNGKTYTGSGAGIRGMIGTSGIPGAGFVTDPQKSMATREFGQLMSLESIKSMSDLLKGATTNQEMDKFASLMADPSTPPEIRARQLDRMLTLVERQKGIAAARIEELRGKAGGQRQPAMEGARVAPDGKTYVPDPNRPGKFLMVQP